MLHPSVTHGGSWERKETLKEEGAVLESVKRRLVAVVPQGINRGTDFSAGGTCHLSCSRPHFTRQPPPPQVARGTVDLQMKKSALPTVSLRDMVRHILLAGERRRGIRGAAGKMTWGSEMSTRNELTSGLCGLTSVSEKRSIFCLRIRRSRQVTPSVCRGRWCSCSKAPTSVELVCPARPA